MSAREPIRRLGELYGIDSSYTDFFGKRRQVPLATERALLQAMGAAVGSAREIADALREAEVRPWRRMLAPVRVIAECGHLLIVERPAACLDAIQAWLD